MSKVQSPLSPSVRLKSFLALSHVRKFRCSLSHTSSTHCIQVHIRAHILWGQALSFWHCKWYRCSRPTNRELSARHLERTPPFELQTGLYHPLGVSSNFKRGALATTIAMTKPHMDDCRNFTQIYTHSTKSRQFHPECLISKNILAISSIKNME